jgi:glycosyltransferase involved in cell wall biosynthesis
MSDIRATEPATLHPSPAFYEDNLDRPTLPSGGQPLGRGLPQRLLFLSRWFPFPADNGSKQRILHLLQSLASSYSVTLLAFVVHSPQKGDMEEAERVCARVHTVPLKSFDPKRSAHYLDFLGSKPRSVSATTSTEMSDWVRRLHAELGFDVVVASQIDMAPYALELPSVPRVLDELELAAFEEQVGMAASIPARMRKRLMWNKRAAYVRTLLKSFDACTVVSLPELRLATSIGVDPERISVVPNGADARPAPTQGEAPVPGSIIYAGSVTYPPNLDAVKYFTEEILPRIREKRPDATLLVTGSTCDIDLSALRKGGGIAFSGLVPEVRELIARSWLSVTPIRGGGGTRVKILEALSLGVPVVSTTKGCEGLDLVPGIHLLIGDDPASFSEAVLSLLEDGHLRSRIGENGRRQVLRRYDWRDIGMNFATVLAAAVAHRKGERAL